jgi:hypothetical protein
VAAGGFEAFGRADGEPDAVEQHSSNLAAADSGIEQRLQ